MKSELADLCNCVKCRGEEQEWRRGVECLRHITATNAGETLRTINNMHE